MNKHEASKLIAAQFDGWVELASENNTHDREYVAFLKHTVNLLRQVPQDRKHPDWDTDTALRVALIAVRLYLKHTDFIFGGGPNSLQKHSHRKNFLEGTGYLHSTIQHTLDGFYTGIRPVHSIERLGLKNTIEERLTSSGAVCIGSMVLLFNSRRQWVMGVGPKGFEEIAQAHELYNHHYPVPTALLPVESECDLPPEISVARSKKDAKNGEEV